MNPSRPSVSRDTRVLLTIVVISMATLWILARIRFPDRVPTPNPVPPVLAQFAPPSAFDDIAASVAQVAPIVEPSLLAIDVERRRAEGLSSMTRISASALRFRDDLALVLVGAKSDTEAFEPTVIGAVEVARDRASHLAVIRMPGSIAPPLSIWSPRRLPSPRFLIAAAVSRDGVSLRPVFVGSLREIATPIWPDPIWALPAPTALERGTFVFTTDGALAGLAVERDGQPALVPADSVISMANRLAREGQRPPGRLGIEVQPLTSSITAATGASTGVVVSWVDPQGSAAGSLRVTDIIEQVDGEPTPTLEHWTTSVARLTDGDSLVITARRGQDVREVSLTAGAVAEPADRPVGLMLRTIPKVGAAVVRVESGSAADHSGLRIGDVITIVGDIEAPTATQASRAFATASRDRPIMIGVTRADTHHVFAFERTW